MNQLAKVFVFKIGATLLFWCLPLILLPASLLEAAGFPAQPTYMFVRMLGWAYLALCVGYAFGLAAALKGARLMGPIWVGIVSNGGACLYLLFYGLVGTWADWGLPLQVLAWGSLLATAFITWGLCRFGVRDGEPRAA
jgi:hypothetical protein